MQLTSRNGAQRQIEIIQHFLTLKLPCYVFKGGALQNKGRASEKLNPGEFEEVEDKKDKEEGNGDLQGITMEPEEFSDNANTNTPQGSNQGGMGAQNN